jgi:hypothetical protein
MKNNHIALVFMLTALSSEAQTWTMVGDTQATITEVSEFNMAINANEDICVGFVNKAGNVRAFARAWKDGKWDNFGTTTGMSASTVNQVQMKLSPDGRFFMLYSDLGLGNDAVLKVYNEATNSWGGYGGFSNGLAGVYASKLQFLLDNNNIPHVGLKVGQFSNTFNVLAYDTSSKNYKVLINSGPSGDVPGEYDMAFSPDNVRYIAYQDTTFSNLSNALARNRLTIKKWENGKWEPVGAPSISEGQPKDISLVFDSKGTPYVAYVNSSSKTLSWASTVRYFDGNDWKPVGPEYFRIGYATYLDFKISPNDTPVLAYSVSEFGGAMNAYAFNGTEWQRIGAENISKGKAIWDKIEFSPNGILYAIYKDDANGGRATVQRYSGNLTSPSVTNSITDKKSIKFSLYPNPTKNILHLCDLPAGSKTIQVKDAYGKTTLQTTCDLSKAQLSIYQLVSGVYFVTVSSKNSSHTLRFIKN